MVRRSLVVIFFFINHCVQGSQFVEDVKKISEADLASAWDLYCEDLKKINKDILKGALLYGNALFDVFDFSGNKIDPKENKELILYSGFHMLGKETKSKSCLLIKLDKVMDTTGWLFENELMNDIEVNCTLNLLAEQETSVYLECRDDFKSFLKKINYVHEKNIEAIKSAISTTKDPLIFGLVGYADLLYNANENRTASLRYSVWLSFLMSTHIQNLVDKNAQNLVDKNAQIYFFKKITFCIFSLAFCYYLYCKFLY